MYKDVLKACKRARQHEGADESEDDDGVPPRQRKKWLPPSKRFQPTEEDELEDLDEN